MKIKHNDIVIPQDDPFKNCRLARKPYAEVLTGLINSYADGFVLAINNEWGTGKTTFVKMWQQQLINDGYKTLCFNAWENDFDSDPLVAIMSELKVLTHKGDDEAYKSLLKKGAILTKSILPLLAKALAEKYIGEKAIAEAISKITEAATEILKDEIDEYTKKKKGLLEFRSELEDFIKKTTGGKPLIFIVDELDRCRPNYAVDVLEQVKHFFNVPGIVFVLSIDKEQLGNAVRGVYGSERINANEYLRRFIDLEYNMPAPNTEIFCRYLYDYFQFDEFLYSVDRTRHNEFRDEKNYFLKFALILFNKDNTTLRQQEKIFAHARVVLNFFTANNYVFPELLLLLIYIRDLKQDLYKQILSRQLSVQTILIDIESCFPKNIDKYDSNFLLSIEAKFIHFYHNYYSEINTGNRLIEKKEGSDEPILTVVSGIDSTERPQLLSYIQSYERSNYSRLTLDYLLKRIDLLGTLVL